MLIYSMSVSVDGFIADREGAFGWTTPSEELFRFHLAQVRELGGYLCGRRLYETMLVWETDPALRDNEPGAAFADVWCAMARRCGPSQSRLTAHRRGGSLGSRSIGYGERPRRRDAARIGGSRLRQSAGALTSRAAFPLTAPASAIAW
jgi:hypothetical protein